MFGITKPRKGETPFMHFGANFSRIYLSALSTNDIVFWFCFDDIKEGCNGNNIPRFTKADEKALVDRFGDDYVSPKWTLREVYEDSTVTGTTAIVEHIYERWHYERILTIGDSAHSVRLPPQTIFVAYTNLPSKTPSAASAARPAWNPPRSS